MVVSMPAKHTDISTTNAIPSVGRWLIGHPPCCALRHSPWERLKKQSCSPDAIRGWALAEAESRISSGLQAGLREDGPAAHERLAGALTRAGGCGRSKAPTRA